MHCKNTGGNIPLSLVDMMNCMCHYMRVWCAIITENEILVD